MKPIKLSMTAFGPYRDEEVIDFTKLGDKQIFVISGPTGAGKTTIFDGICFALYGSVSGEERENAGNIRSDFADDTLHTSIELIFEMKNKRYRILRQMAHIKKGNKTPTGDKTEFVEITSSGEEPILDSHKVKDLNNKLEEIIGLTQDQFKQIVMLPQGEFRKLLTSDSKNKGDILRKIFKTENYKKMADRLKDKKDVAEKELQLLKNEQEIYISHITELFEQRASELFEVLAKEYKSTNQIVAALLLEKKYYEEQLIPLKEQQAVQQLALSTERKSFIDGEHFNKLLQGYQASELRLKQLDEQSEQYQEKEKKVSNANKAEHIIPYEQSFRQTRQQFNQLTQETEVAGEQLQQAKNAVENAQQQYTLASENEVKIEELKKQINEWQNILPIYEELTSLENDNKNIIEKLSQSEISFQTAKEQFDTLQKEIPQKEELLSTFKSQTSNIDELQRQYYTFEKIAVQVDTKVAAQYSIEQNEILLKKEHEKLEEQQQTYRQLENAWLSNQALELASQLVDGEACPVCGSTNHIIKHQETVELTVSRQDIQEAQVAMKKIEQNLYAVQIALKNEHLKVEEAVKSIAQFDKVRVEEATIHQTIKDLYQTIASKLKVKEQVLTLETELLHMRRKMESRRITVENLQKSVIEFQYKKREIQLVIQEKRKYLPEQFKTQQAVVSALQTTANELKQLQQLLKTSIDKLESNKQQEIIAETSFKSKQTQLATLTKALADSEVVFKEKVLSAGFEDGSAYVEARLEPHILESLKEDILHYTNERYAKQQQIIENASLYAGKLPINLIELQANIDRMTEAFDHLLHNIQQMEQTIQKSERIEKQLATTNEKMKVLENRAGHIIKLYDLLAGKNNLKISFERYLQIEYLEQIIHAANVRLQPLSNGQYRLLRSERLDGNGKQSGLSLDVYDTYTGQGRDVKTLSGGEQFNASLCLALGMSDIIQGFKGNVHMDTMFIDEGFGTLDEEALSKAIDTLVELQKTGRMIGIISHVSELKDTIPATLEVIKSKEGYSHSRFVIK